LLLFESELTFVDTFRLIRVHAIGNFRELSGSLKEGTFRLLFGKAFKAIIFANVGLFVTYMHFNRILPQKLLVFVILWIVEVRNLQSKSLRNPNLGHNQQRTKNRKEMQIILFFSSQK
jgi:hypothetical protein